MVSFLTFYDMRIAEKQSNYQTYNEQIFSAYLGVRGVFYAELFLLRYLFYGIFQD